MTGPAVLDTPEARLAAIQGQTPEARLSAVQGKTPEERLAAILATTPADPNAALHASFKSGRLAKNNADKNAAEKVGVGDYLKAASEIPETVAAGVPGAKLLISKGRSLVQGRPMADVQQEVNAETSDVPYASAIGRAAGTLALTPVLPGAGWQSGALLGGADQLLNNDPNSGPINRGLRTVAGVVGGGLLGKAADRLVTAGRALVSPTAASARNALLATRTKEAADLYRQALAEGKNGATQTQPILDFLTSPDIAPIVADLKASRTHANTDEFSPEMLDAVYKVLSDQGNVAKSKLAALVPRNANLGRVAQKDIALAKEQGLNAMSGGAGAPMPTYAKAVENFADNSRNLDAFDTGYEALRSGVSGNLVSAKNLSRANKTPESFADWLTGKVASSTDAANAARGVISGVRSAKTMKSLDAAAKLLRSTDAATGTFLPNYLQKSIPAGLMSYLSGKD